MRLEELELFRRAAAKGVLSAAGRELGLSPAAATARLQSLERSLGATLFTRSTRKLTLTEEGELLLGHAERALDELEAAQSVLQTGSQRPAGLLRISVVEPFAVKHIIPHLPDFAALYPDITIDMHTSDAFVSLTEGGYEMAVRIAPLADSALTAAKLAPNRRVLVATEAYLAKHGVPEIPEDLSAHTCLIHTQVPRWRLRRGDGAQREERIHRPKGVVSSNSSAVVRDGALAGLGIALKSLWDAGAELNSGQLIRVLPEWEAADEGAIWAVRPPARYASPRARALILFLKERYGRRPYWDID